MTKIRERKKVPALSALHRSPHLIPKELALQQPVLVQKQCLGPNIAHKWNYRILYTSSIQILYLCLITNTLCHTIILAFNSTSRWYS